MRLLVCGGRNYFDWDAIFSVLQAVHNRKGITTVIQGGARGADRGAAEWGWKNNIEVHTYHADWKAHGNRAGPVRNQRMLDEARPDGVVAFPGGPGTADMIARAQRAGLKVWAPFGGRKK